jgi:hypothetical protein
MATGQIDNVFYPRVALNATAPYAAVAGQALSVSGTVTASFASFQVSTKLVFFDIQSADVICTLDGTTNPVLLSKGHRLASGTNYTWNASVAASAKFVSTGASSFLYLQELAV